MVKEFRPAKNYMKGIGTSEFRRRLSHYIGCVRYGGDFVAIRRKGEDNVYLISQFDWDLLGRKITDLDSGKFDPKLRVRHSGLWELLNWESRKESVADAIRWAKGAARSDAAPETPSTEDDMPEAKKSDAMALVDGALERLAEIERRRKG